MLTHNYIHNKQDLSLTTLKVEIKAIRVNNKAMTISVFNQIPVNDINKINWLDVVNILGLVRHQTSKGLKLWYVINHKNFGLIKAKANKTYKTRKYDASFHAYYNDENDTEDQLLLDDFNLSKCDDKFIAYFKLLFKNIGQIYIAV
tara:strand:+ start:23 stop:460 length:438 start_codon:yes stop_codon:yes gene_type:complete